MQPLSKILIHMSIAFTLLTSDLEARKHKHKHHQKSIEARTANEKNSDTNFTGRNYFPTYSYYPGQYQRPSEVAPISQYPQFQNTQYPTGSQYPNPSHPLQQFPSAQRESFGLSQPNNWPHPQTDSSIHEPSHTSPGISHSNYQPSNHVPPHLTLEYSGPGINPSSNYQPSNHVPPHLTLEYSGPGINPSSNYQQREPNYLTTPVPYQNPPLTPRQHRPPSKRPFKHNNITGKPNQWSSSPKWQVHPPWIKTSAPETFAKSLNPSVDVSEDSDSDDESPEMNFSMKHGEATVMNLCMKGTQKINCEQPKKLKKKPILPPSMLKVKPVSSKTRKKSQNSTTKSKKRVGHSSILGPDFYNSMKEVQNMKKMFAKKEFPFS